ncbi:hypothetical protein BH11ACT8_BH11ACT8_10990 [soil metagenome]
MGPELPAFAPVARLRPVTLARPRVALGRAPYAAAEASLAGGAGEVSLTSGEDGFSATWDGSTVAITSTLAGKQRRHVSRRHGGGRDPDALAITLTGPRVAALAHEDGAWVVRAVLDLTHTTDAPDVHDESWLAGLTGRGDRVGGFGQLGLRDLRVVTHADGTPYDSAAGTSGALGAEVLLTATSAGPGGFRTAHTSVWALDPVQLSLEHRADLYFRRPDRPGVYGDHATHLLRDGDRWLVATSTWGTFDTRRDPHVTTTLAGSSADLTRGTHVLDTVPLRLPTTGLRSVGVWDPHLVRTDDGWLAAYVSARKFFSFHPVVAAGPDLEGLVLRSAATGRTATEGPTLTRVGDTWWVLASDGRDGRTGTRGGEPATYPVLDLDLRQHGTLRARYPTNIPWPTIVEHTGGNLLVGFDATPYGGPLPGYGTHGEVVLQRAR